MKFWALLAETEGGGATVLSSRLILRGADGSRICTSQNVLSTVYTCMYVCMYVYVYVCVYIHNVCMYSIRCK